MFWIVAKYVTSLILLYLVWKWLEDLRFYKKHGWDFSRDHPGFEIFEGEIPGGEPMSNDTRVIFGWPLLVFAFAVATTGLWLI